MNKCGIQERTKTKICWTPPPPLTCQLFLDMHTALRKGRRAGIPRADATTEKALAVVLRTYSSMLSMSGRMAAIIEARPAAYCRDSQSVGVSVGLVWGL